jgi:hypothetical protein
MRPTLVAIRTLNLGDHVFHHGAEIIPGLLSQDTVNKLVDRGRLREYDPSERRSLYRLFAPFSGCEETERPTKEELTAYALQE